MILERLAVKAFGCLRDPIELEFDERFTLVIGENEAGKTTLFRALHHALFTPYSSNAQEIRDLQSWGTELSPEVTVTFRIGEQRYQVTKSFLHQPRCVLAEWDGTRFRDVADADRADERIRAFLLGERPGRGVAQEEHRGLARLLWIPQGAVAMPEIQGSVRQQIEESLGAMTLDEGEGRLHSVITGLYADIWTKNGKGFVKGSGLPQLAEEVARLEADLNAAQETLCQAEQTSRRLDDVQADLAAREAEDAELEKAIGALDAEARRVNQLKMARETKRAELEKVIRRFERLAAARERLRIRQEEAKKARETLEQSIQPQLEALEQALKGAESRRGEVLKELALTEKRVKLARTAWQRARSLRDANGLSAEITRLSERLRAVEQVEGELAELRERLARLPNPTEKTIKEARALEAERQRLEGRLHAVGISVAFTAEREHTGTVVRDDGAETPFAVKAAEEMHFSAARSMEWTIAGVGRFAIGSGAEEAAELQEEHAGVAERLKALLAGFGAASVAQLDELRQARRDVERDLAGRVEKVKQLLEGAASPDEVKSALAERERRLAAMCSELDVTPESLDGLEAPDEKEAQAAFERAEAEHAVLGQQLDQARGEIEGTQKQMAGLKERQATEAEKLRAAERDVEEILAEHGSETDLMNAFREVRIERDASEHAVEELTKQLPPEDEDPEREQTRLKTEQKAIRNEISALKETRAKLQQQLDDVAAKGTYGAAAELEETLAQKREEYDQLVRQAKAIKLLKGLCDARQQRVLDQLTAPIASRVSRYFEQVSGYAGREVAFDQSLRPAAVSVRAQAGVSTDVLSTGAREQLQILSRLALGRYLASKQGRLLFVLDDSLVNTDSGRHRKLLDLLAEAQEELQVVLLTCHPEWCRGLKNVERVALRA